MIQGKWFSSICAAGLALAAISPALADDDCENGGPKSATSCPAGSFRFLLMDQIKTDPVCEEKSSCVALEAGIGPSPSFITCEAKGDAFSCSAWPQGDMKYSWVLGEGLDPLRGNQSGDAVQSMRCAADKGSTLMSVTVTAPNGLSETVFSQVVCGSQGVGEDGGEGAHLSVQKNIASR
jgi:hypothetical protein